MFETVVSDYTIIVSGEGEIEAKSANVLQTPMVWPAPTLSYIVPEGSFVDKDDVVAVFTQSQVENELINMQDELAIATAEGQRTEADLNLQSLLYESQLTIANASAKSAQLQLARIEFEAPRTQEIKRLEIEQFAVEADRARKRLLALEKIQAEERAHADLRIQQARNKLNSAKDQISRLTLKAPHSGIVVYETNPITEEKVQVGSTLFPRMPVVKLPDLSVMQIRMQIGETDAQKLRQGMPARIFVPSLDNVELNGKVVKVDRVAKPIRRGSKVKKVEVVVEIEEKSDVLRPGLTATADISVRTATGIIAIAQECLFEKDSIKIVYKESKNGFQPIPVASLLQDEDFIIIYGALKGGERLAMEEPPNTRVYWPDSLVAVAAPAAIDTFKIEPEKREANSSLPPELLRNMNMPPPGAKINPAQSE